VADGVSAQANLMSGTTVPDAMVAAYRDTGGTLAERLLAALDAAEDEGGDLRGRQSAAGDVEGALAAHESACAERPDSAELAFWHGVALAASGREQEARGPLEQAYRAGDGWRELLRRLPAAGLFPDDAELVGRLTSPELLAPAPVHGLRPPPSTGGL
jgi:hypothetical protein